jgi:glucose/arabinose dehydrogenase
LFQPLSLLSRQGMLLLFPLLKIWLFADSPDRQYWADMYRTTSRFCLWTALVMVLGISMDAFAARKPAPAVQERYLQKDFPFQRAAIRAGFPKGNLANKGIAIRLGENASVLFDTDLLRLAAGWTGGFITTTGVSFDGKHGQHPAIHGEQQFGLGNQPGWADTSGTFEDPRDEPFGPLPADWCRWDGLYVAGMDVVLAYTVHGTKIHDQPSMIEDGDSWAFVRTFQIGRNADSLTVALGQIPVDADGIPSLKVGITGKDGVELDEQDGIAVVRIPAGFGPAVFAVGAGPKGEAFNAFKERNPSLTKFEKGGPTRWTEPVVTKGRLNTSRTPDAAYVTDSLTAPLKNPWNRRIRFGGMDFFANGTSAALSTWGGDVFTIAGIDAGLGKLTWRRIASGGFENLGLKIVDGTIYTVGRDEITRYHDLNGDGETDYYENFCNLHTSSQGFHEFAFDLHADKAGNFYFAKAGPVRGGGRGFGGGGGNGEVSASAGCLMKVDKTGRKMEVIATGFRAPTGIGLGPDGQLTTGDNEGTWVPRCPINWVEPGGFYGVEDLAHGTDKSKFRQPLCWLDKSWDNSGGGQAWVTSDRWGPFAGELLHASYGRSSLYLVLKEQVAGQMQGGVVKIPVRFSSSAMRLRFNPVDGQLYNAGLKGWQSNAIQPAGFDRIRYTGAKVFSVKGLKVDKRGVHLTFTQALDRESAEDLETYAAQRWNYQRTSNYGSPEISVSDPKRRGKDTLEIRSAKLSKDGRTVTLKIADLKPVMQQLITFKNLLASDGTKISQQVMHTINVLQ